MLLVHPDFSLLCHYSHSLQFPPLHPFLSLLSQLFLLFLSPLGCFGKSKLFKPSLNVQSHTFFVFLSGDIYLFCLVYYLHITHNLCLQIPWAILYLHSLSASCPIFLLSGPFISLSVSQPLLITTLLILSLSRQIRALRNLPAASNTEQIWKPNIRRCKSVFNRRKSF